MLAFVRNASIHVDLTVDKRPSMRCRSCPPNWCDRATSPVKEGREQKSLYVWHGEAWLPKDTPLASTHSVAHSTSANGDTHQASAATQDSKRRSRPGKGMRLRRKKFIEKVKAAIAINLESFSMDEVSWPPSLQCNAQQLQSATRRLENYQQQVLAAV